MNPMKKVVLLLIFAVSFCSAQQLQLKKADKNYDTYAYVNAIEVYEKIAQKGYASADLYEKLGNSYYLNGQYDKAAQSYKSLLSLGTPFDSEVYFRYSHCLKALNQYDEADKMMANYFEANSNNSQKKNLNNYLNEIKNNSRNYIVKSTAINTSFSDYGPSYYKNQVFFTSAMDSAAVRKLTHKWTGQNYTDIYVANVNKDTTLSYVGNFSNKVNTKFNEATAVFTKDGSTVFFTRNNFNEGKKGKSSDKSTFVKIYRAKLVNNEWDNVTELPFNSNEFSIAHPALSPDEKILYFASDMPGTIGNSDIYKASINSDGTLGNPENLGNLINTSGRETFPSLDQNGNLYFASDGHLGLGGLDVFVAKVKPDGSFEKPINLGNKLNSAFDDFGMTFINPTSGFFSSNREGGKGFDDIYFFKELICAQKANGIVYDAQTNQPITAAQVILFDENMKEVDKVETKENGFYEFNVDCSKKYYIRGLKEEYEPAEVKLLTTNEDDKIFKNDLFLNKKQIPVAKGTDLAKLFNISKIHFDLDKWNIRPDAEVHLQKVIEVLKQYPAMTLDIRSHTDSRQTHNYNEVLSDRRAKSTLEYMVKQGIARERLTAKGFGETQLINGCADGVKCSEEEHQQNRRSEFIITKVE